MHVKRIALRGVIPFPKTEAVLDLAGIPPGLVAVGGDNGSGKTTLLESVPMALYGVSPSKPRMGHLSELACTRDASIVIDLCGNDGTLWQATRLIDGTKHRMEAHLFREGQPVGRGGKVREFGAAVDQFIGPASLFFASVFAAQGGAGRLTGLEKKDRRDMFTALIGAGELQRLAELAKKRADAEATRATHAKAQEAAVIGAVDTGEDLEAMASTARQDRDAAVAAHDVALAAHRAQAEALAAAKGKLAAVDAAARAVIATKAAADRAGAAVELAEREFGDARMLACRHADVVAATLAYEAAQKVAREANAALALASANVRTRADEVRRAADRIETLRMRLTEADRRVETARAATVDPAVIANARAALADAVTRRDEARARLDAATSRLAAVRDLVARHREALALCQVARDDLARATKVAEMAAGVPCAGEGKFGGCKYLSTAILARDALPACRKIVADRQAAADAIAEEAGGVLPTVLALAQEVQTRADQTWRAVGDQVRVAQAEVDRLACAEVAAAKLDAEVTAQQALVADVTQAADVLAAASRGEETAKTIEAAARAANDAAEDDVVPPPVDADQVRMAHANLPRLDADVGRAHAELDRAITAWGEATAQPHDVDDMRHVVEGMSRAERDAAASEAEARVRADRAKAEDTRLEERARAWAKAREAAATHHEVAVTAAVDADEWSALTKALGREGVQAHELDAAGPQVTGIINELLHAAFGRRFTVELVTTKLGGEGQTIEVFDLQVLDNERGTVSLVDVKSGGEAVVLNEAIGCGLAIYAANRAPVRWTTLFRDETAGALSPDNAVRYVEMLRRARDIGGFRHVVFVAHQREVLEGADTRVIVADGAVRLA